MNCRNVNQTKPQNNQNNNVNYSITMNGIESCSHSCVYCSAASTLNYAQGVNKQNLDKSLKDIDEKTFNEFVADFPKMEETIEHNSRFRRAKEIQEKGGKQATVSIDLWGGDPVTCHLATQETVDFLEYFFVDKHGMKLELSSSTGGLPLARKDICDYYKEHNIGLQISHDGCGQWMRTGEIDPLYDERMHDNIAELFTLGNLKMVNDCLNFYNGDLFANHKYWMDYFKSINLPMDKFNKLYVKLNRCYDGEYDIQRKNHLGIFGSDKRVWKELIDKPFGDMRHHNWKNLNSGNLELDHKFAHELDDYLNDWLRVAMIIRDPNRGKEWKPFYSYLNEQLLRWKQMSSWDDSNGMCRRYQRTVHGIGDPDKWTKPNEFGDIEMFVIDTKGKYCECNLIDSDHTVKNIGCEKHPKACEYCKYKFQSECLGCGSEIFTEDCEWRYRWVAMLEQIKLMDKLIETREKKAFENGHNKGINEGRIAERTDIGAAYLNKMWNDIGLQPLSNK